MIDALVPTDVACAFLARDGLSTAMARETIYGWSKRGLIANHGSVRRGRALWSLRELQNARKDGVYEP